MQLRHFILFAFSLPVAFGLGAQDLIENGSFDVPKGKLKKMGSIEMAKGWTSPTEAKADLFSDQLTESSLSAERNQYGGQAPRTGNYYAGIRVYSPNDREPRSYLQTTFTTPLVQGQKYCVKYYVSHADLSRFSTGELRAFLSKVPVEKDDMAGLTYNAQIPVEAPTPYSSLDEWQGVCGIYEAQGEEQYLIIGNFTATKETEVGKVKKPKGEVRPQAQHGYYFIDDVSVTPVTVSAECNCGPSKPSSTTTGFIFGRSTIDGDRPVGEKIDRQVFYFQRYQQNIHSSMQAYVEELAGLMKEDPEIKIKLIGHLDELEKVRYQDREDQDQMGRERAEAVRSALVKLGIEAERITAEGKSDEELVDPSGSEIGMSKNRRVEVEVVE